MATASRPVTLARFGVHRCVHRLGSVPLSYRGPVDGQQKAVDEVCMEELRDLALQSSSASTDEEACLVAMARRLVIQRLRAVSRSRLTLALQRAMG